MKLKNSLLTILISTTFVGCSISKISLKINYKPFPITLKVFKKPDGNYGRINFWPDKLNFFFDRNKNGNFELKDLTETYTYLKKFNLSKELRKSCSKNPDKAFYKKFYSKINKQLDLYLSKKK